PRACWRGGTAGRFSALPRRSRWVAGRWAGSCASGWRCSVHELRVAVVGASGLVGREILRLLDERSEPPAELRLLGSPRTAGATVEEGDVQARVELLRPGAFDEIDVAFFAAGPSVALEWAPVAAQAGAAGGGLCSRVPGEPGGPHPCPGGPPTAPSL